MRVIIHCSDSRFGNAALIAKWHTLPKPQGRGWSNIGYHKVILNGHLSNRAYDANLDGHVETGRPLDSDDMVDLFEYGAHTRGYNDTVGVCLIGESGKFTNKQLFSLEKELKKLHFQFKGIEVEQHSFYDPSKPYCAGLSKDYMDKLKYLFD